MFDLGKACWLTGLFYFMVFSMAGQDKEGANELMDPLFERSDEAALHQLKEMAEDETNPDTKLEYAEILIKNASKDSLINFLHSGYLQKGNAYQLKGNFPDALDAYFESLRLLRLMDDVKGEGALMISIADTYNMSGNYQTSEKYYLEAIELLRIVNDSVKLATALLNAGDLAVNSKKFTVALKYFEESGEIFKNINHPLGIAYNLGNVGMVYAEQGKDSEAEKNIDQAIDLLEDLEQYYPISVFLTYMSDIYKKKNDLPGAFAYSERSLEIARSHGLKDQISEAHLQLASLNESVGNYKEAYEHFQDYVVYRDSVNNLESIQEMAELRNNYEIENKQNELDLLTQKQKTQRITVIGTGVALFLICLLALGLYRRNKFANKTRRIIEKEKNRSDLLLLNILPQETAQELKNFGKVESKRFDSVTVLFTDFKDFTKYSESLTPEELVKNVDYYFSKFDDIIDKYGLEKIKTIGDAYMCAGGLPFETNDHALKVVLAAIDILEFVKKSKDNTENDKLKFDIRIGINSGPVVAGVVGKKKFAYDIWGDTVNIAARMESNCGTGQINISENTYELIKDHCKCEYRGEIKVKNKGRMKMYYVSSLKKKIDGIKVNVYPDTPQETWDQ